MVFQVAFRRLYLGMTNPRAGSLEAPVPGVQIVQVPLPSKGEDVYGVFPQEDGSLLVVVVDGHGGKECAARALGLLDAAFAQAYGEAKDAASALAQAGRRVARETAACASGGVYTAVWLPGGRDRLVYGQLGDTAAFWRDREGRLARTPDHNVRVNRAELERALGRGGWFAHGYLFSPAGDQGVQSARVIGDAAMGGVVDRLPQIGAGELGRAGYLVLCSDGLCDPSHADPSSEGAFFESFLHALEASGSVVRAVEALCAFPFIDDVTVLAVRLGKDQAPAIRS